MTIDAPLPSLIMKGGMEFLKSTPGPYRLVTGLFQLTVIKA